MSLTNSTPSLRRMLGEFSTNPTLKVFVGPASGVLIYFHKKLGNLQRLVDVAYGKSLARVVVETGDVSIKFGQPWQQAC